MNKAWHLLAQLNGWWLGLIIIPAVVYFSIPSVDLRVQSYFFQPDNGWWAGEKTLWRFLYHFGQIPAILLGITSLRGFILSWFNRRSAPYRRASLFMLLLLIIGPGLLINLVFKDNWGKPRPRQTVQFGGTEPYRAFWQANIGGKGESFPCGHASVGFYFLGLYYLLYKNRLRWAVLAALLALVYGSLIGVARVAQGGHYISDVAWAALMVWATAMLLAYWLRPWELTPAAVTSDISVRWQIVFNLPIPELAMLLLFLLGTPYNKKDRFSLPPSVTSSGILRVDFDIENASLSLIRADSLFSKGTADGFGLPGSEVKKNVDKWQNGDTLRVEYTQRKRGWFAEMDNRLQLGFPAVKKAVYNVRLHQGQLGFKIADWPGFTIVENGHEIQGGIPEAPCLNINWCPEATLVGE